MADLRGYSMVAGYPVWHMGNMGSGSGLDGDTVDGFHLDQDVRTTATPTFAGLKLTGDIVNDGAERHFKATGTNINWGFHVSNTRAGIFDWQNNHNVIDYIAANNSVGILVGAPATSGSVITPRVTLDDGSGNAIFGANLSLKATGTKLITFYASDGTTVESKIRDNGSGTLVISAGGADKTLILRANSDTDTTNELRLTSSQLTLGGNKVLTVAGDTMTGLLTLSGNPTANLHAATKQYVDSIITKLADNAHNVNDPNDRYPDSVSYFASTSLTYGFPNVGSIETWRGAGSSDNYDYQRLIPIDDTKPYQMRYALTTSKTAWAANTTYAVNDLRMPTSSKENGHYYKCTTAGTTTATEPTWSTTTGATIQDNAGSSTWAANTAKSIGNLVVPTTGNGMYYKCTTAGTTGPIEPGWSTTPGATINDNGSAITWAANTVKSLNNCVVPTTGNGFYYKCTTAGTTAPTAPTFPTTSGATVTDNGGAVAWAANTAKALNNTVTGAAGMYYKCTTAGTTGPTAPTWSSTPGATINDNGGAVTWAANTVKALNNTVVPTTGNGFYYKCTTAGTTGPVAPTFPTTAGATVNDNGGAVTWTASAAKVINNCVIPTVPNGFYYKCTTAGTTGTSEPTWLTTSGATVNDGTAVWTAYVIPVWTAYVMPVWTTYTAPVWTAYVTPVWTAVTMAVWTEAGTFWSAWDTVWTVNNTSLLSTAGKVSIGSTNSVEILDVYGNIMVGGSTADNYITFRGTNGDLAAGAGTFIGERVYSGTEQSELFLFKGNDIEGTAGADRIRMAASNIVFDTYSVATGGAFETVATSANLSTKMIIKQDGSVGIGTTAPASLVTIQENVAGGRGAELSLVNGATSTIGNEVSINFGLEASTYDTNNCNAQIKAILTNASNSADLVFSTWNGSAFGEKLRITGAGDVGIGTTSPSARLHVAGSGNAANLTNNIATFTTTGGSAVVSVLSTSSSSSAAYLLGMGTLPTASIQTEATSGDLDFYTSPVAGPISWYKRLTILNSNGNVGIGTASPQDKLNVVGGFAQIGLNTDAMYTTLSNNNVSFHRNGPSYMDQNTVGGSLSFRVSRVTTLDTIALTLDTNGDATFYDQVTANKFVTNNTDNWSQFIRNNAAAAAIYVNQATTTGDIASFIGGSSTPGDSANYVLTIKAGGAVQATGDYKFKSTAANVYGSGIIMVAPVTTAWNRGILYKKADDTTIMGGLGMSATGDTTGYLYAGFGTTPWTNAMLKIDATNNVQITAPQVASPSSNNSLSHLTLLSTGSSRTIGTGSALAFSVPANTDGTNPWEQGRILVTPDNTNNGDAAGRMYLQTRYLNGGTTWAWRNNILLTSDGSSTFAGAMKFNDYVEGSITFSTIMRLATGNASTGYKMHDGTQTTALYIENYIGTSDSGGLAIDNDAVTIFGSGDQGYVFRVIDEDTHRELFRVAQDGNSPQSHVFGSLTVDGALLVNGNGSYYEQPIRGGDCNNLVADGVYDVQDNSANKPEGCWGTVYVSHISHSLWLQQLWLGQYGSIFIRTSSDGGGTRNWGGWSRVSRTSWGTSAPSGGNTGDIYIQL